MKGLFITVEGLDGCGKSTQIKLIKEFFTKKGYDVVVSLEPGGTKIADKIRDILLDPENKNMNERCELFLYLASRAQHTYELIIPSIKSGKIVICSRYFDATIAYQGFARGLSLDFIEESNKFATFGIKPDLTIIIDIEPVKGIEKARKTAKKHNTGDGDRMEQEKLEFYEKVRKGYFYIAQKDPERIKIIKYEEGVNKVFEKIKKYLQNLL